MDPWNKRVSCTAPKVEIFSPISATENNAITHQKEISAKKLGCREYLNKP